MPPEWMRKIFALCIHETTLYILGIQLAVMMGPLTAPQLLGIIVKYVWIIFHLSIPANGRIWQYITYANKCISADWHVVILWSFRILWERGLNAILLWYYYFDNSISFLLTEIIPKGTPIHVCIKSTYCIIWIVVILILSSQLSGLYFKIINKARYFRIL